MNFKRVNSFRITLYLSHFYHDHRSVCRIFVSNKMKTVKDLKTRISEIFGIENYYLTSQNHFLPDQEDVRILESDDIIIAIPNKILPLQTEDIPAQNETICTPKSKDKERKKKKRKITEIEDPEAVVQQSHPMKKKKKKRKEKHCEYIAAANTENTQLVGKAFVHLQTHSNELPSKSSNIQSKGSKIPENAKLLETINYFETLKNSPYPKSNSTSKIKPLILEPNVKADFEGIFDNKDLKSHITSSAPNSSCIKSNVKTTEKINIQPLENKSEVNEKLASNLDHREVKSHILYSSTPKHDNYHQNQKNSSFGPPIMKIERKINIVKNIVTHSSNIVSNMEIDTNDEEINRQIVNIASVEKEVNDNIKGSVNKLNFVNRKSSDIINKVVINNNIECVDKAVNNSNVNENGQVSNFMNDNKKYPKTDKMTDGKNTLSDTVNDTNEIVSGNNQDCLNSIHSLNDLESKSANEKVTAQNVLEIVSINDTASNNSTPHSTCALPSNAVSKIKTQDAISINSDDTYSETYESLISASYDDLDRVNQNSECVSIRSKRKRIRKRKKKSSENIQIDTPDPIVPFKPVVCEANPKIHIRFDENQDCTAAEDDSIISIKSENESLIAPIVETIGGNFEELQNNEKGKNEDCGLNEKIILSCPTMKTLTPKQCDVITFKILKMSETYTPEHSKYITGKVDKYDSKTGNIDIFILEGRQEFAEPQGKFSLIEDETDNTEEIQNQEIVTLNWNNLVDPRLLYP